MNEVITLGSLAIAVQRKNIKNMYLKVHPPDGDVLISAPSHLQLETIRMFAITKLPWIKQQRQQIQSQEREPAHDYVNRESHYLWGDRYLLKIVEANKPPQISRSHQTLLLQVRPKTSPDQKEAIIAQWYREQLKQAIPPLIEKWELIMGVTVNRFFVQKMKTKWGSCNITAKNIRLNLELAKKPKKCLEYVVVHEMTHLLEPTHNKNFVALMDSFLPDWKNHQELLNTLPINS
ncbi:MAG: SprT family zinc-dependent metalloprotease [Snowella sp.]|nr:SprT family zinc-dependent metalloprotease [Snowella sp.]